MYVKMCSQAGDHLERRCLPIVRFEIELREALSEGRRRSAGTSQQVAPRNTCLQVQATEPADAEELRDSYNPLLV